MPTFLDESGDTGHKRHSTPYFRLAAVHLPTAAAAAAFRASVRQVRIDLGVRADFEFKYARTHHHPDRRAAFFDAALAHGFRFVVCCIDKTSGPWRTALKDDFYYSTTMYVASTLRPVLLQAAAAAGRHVAETVLADDNEDGEFLAAVGWAFRGVRSVWKPDLPLCERPEFYTSHRDEMLQLADMVCGAVGDHLEGNSMWYRRFRRAGLGVDCGWGVGLTCLP